MGRSVVAGSSNIDVLLHADEALRRPRTLRERVRLTLSVAMSVLLVATLWTFVERPARAAAAPVAAEKLPCPADRPDETAALVTARMCGGEVEIASMLTETTRAWAQPDGTVKVEQGLGQERFRNARGEWVEVDLTLARRADGSVAPVAHPRGLVLSGAVGSGDHDLASLAKDGQTLRLGWRGALPEPVLDRTKATYAEVRPGVDLVVESTRTSFLYSVVAKSPQAMAALGSLSLPWRSGNLSTVAAAKGGLELRDAKGAVSATIPTGSMWDAVVEPNSGEHVHRATVGVGVADALGGKDLVLSPDQEFLARKDLQYPVTVDPGPIYIEPSFDEFVQTGYTADQSGSTELKLGTYDGGTNKAARTCRFTTWVICVTRSSCRPI